MARWVIEDADELDDPDVARKHATSSGNIASNLSSSQSQPDD
jgi:hypothetical protein